ncbi:MAG: EpsG family protein [Muribaculaceae bacterium]|nr:EpsG family protein [Muribaculaceae bacterium]
MIWILILILCAIGICSAIDNNPEKPNHWLRISLFILLAFIIGIRHKVGIDYDVYVELFERPNSYRAGFVEPLWIWLNKTLAGLSYRPRMFFVVSAAYTMFAFYKGIEKDSRAFYISTLFFVLFGFYFETANTVRQCAAMGTLMWGYSYLVEKRWIPALLLGFLSINLHLSAIFGVILIAVSYIKINRWILFSLLMATMVFGSMLMEFAMNVMFPILGTINKYQYEVDQFDAGVSSGVLKYVYGVLGTIMIFACTDIREDRSEVLRLLNLTIYGLCVYNTFYVFQPARRLYTYGFMFSILLMPHFLSYFQPKVRYGVATVITAIFLFFLAKSNLEVAYNYDFIFL